MMAVHSIYTCFLKLDGVTETFVNCPQNVPKVEFPFDNINDCSWITHLSEHLDMDRYPD